MASGLSLGNSLSIPTKALTPQAGLSPGSGLTDGGLGGSSGPPPAVSNGFLLENSASDLILLESGDYLLQEAAASGLTANFILTQSLPEWLSRAAPPNDAMLYDASGNLSYGPNNLLLYSNTPTNAAWINVATTFTSGATDPLSGTNAWRAQGTTSLWAFGQSITAYGSVMVTCWVKSNTGSSQTFRMFGNSSTLSSDFTATTSWQQFSYVFTQDGAKNVGICRDASNNTADLLVYAPTVSLVTAETSARSQDQIITTSIAYYGPRFDYNPSASAYRGLLIEQGGGNLMPNARDLTKWTNATGVSLNQGTGIDGANSLTKIVHNGSTVLTQITNAYTFVPLTLSFVVKYGTQAWHFLDVNDGAEHFAWFNLATGQLGSADAGVSSSITSLGGGFYIISLTYQPTSATFVFCAPTGCTGDGSSTKVSTNTTVFVQYPQLFAASATYPITTSSGVKGSGVDFFIPPKQSAYASSSVSWRDKATGNLSTLSFAAGAWKLPSATGWIEEVSVTDTTSGWASTEGKGLILGDSTIAAYLGQSGVNAFLISSEDAALGATVVNQAVPGATIANQEATFSSDPNKATYDWFVVQIGLNDLDPAEAASVAIGRLQTLIDTINAAKKSGAKILISAMLPCRQRLIDLYGATNGAISYQKWQDMNAAIMGQGATPITGVDARNDLHVWALGNGADMLNLAYEVSSTVDHIHENNAARNIIALCWRYKLQSLNIFTTA